MARAAAIAQGLKALDSRKFRVYLFGQMASSVGTGMQAVAVAWLVWRLTHSAGALAALGACTFVPQILFSVLGGCLADRMERRRLLLLLQAAGSVLAFCVALALCPSHHSLWLVLGLAFLSGSFAAIEYPARHAFSATILPPAMLVSARGLYSSTCAVSLACGQILSGVLIDRAGEYGEIACVFVNAVSYAVAWFMLRQVGKMPHESLEADAAAARLALADVGKDTKASVVNGAAVEDSGYEKPVVAPLHKQRKEEISLKDCVNFIAGSRVVAFTFLQTGILVLFGMRYVMLIPALAQEVFRGAAGASGMLNAAVAIGFSAASLACGTIASRSMLFRLSTAALLFMPLALVGLAGCRDLSLGLVVVLGLAFLQSTNINAGVVGMQLASPDGMFGRLMGLRITMVATLDLAGAIIVGQMVPHIGLTSALVWSGVGCLIAALLSGLLFAEVSGIALPARVMARFRSRG